MPSDYEKILEENLVEYGRGTRHLEFLRRLYADRTHFLYELLQNAEDAKATSVRFDLHPDRLELRHDGRLFDERDVRGLCGVAEGTKEDDLTQIGRFGIGFKSVYAYTNSPVIHSGEEYFRIEGYIRPHSVESSTDLPAGQTLFLFPFDREEVPAPQAFVEIRNGLSKLSARVLLFLRSIDHIDWTVHPDQRGSYLREVASDGPWRSVTLVAQEAGKEMAQEDWLATQRSVQAEDATSLLVEAAFCVRQNKDGTRRVIPIDSSKLVVFFPTDNETHLHFIIQGPYRTTPARDNIPKDDAWNQQLVEETAVMVADALGIMRDTDLLSPEALECMPIRTEDFPVDSMFRPLFDRVKIRLITEPLIPGFGGGYVTAADGCLARGSELRVLLDDSQLRELRPSSDDARWLDERITDKNELSRYLTEELGVKEVTPETVVGWLTDSFIEAQSDDWIGRLYGFLATHPGLWQHPWAKQHDRIRGLALLRLEDGSHVTPFDVRDQPKAYLPPKGETEFPIVKRSIASDAGTRSFLETLGLNEPDVVDEVLVFTLRRYQSLGPAVLTVEEIGRDMERVKEALASDSSDRKKLADRLRRTRWIRATNATEKATEFRAPSDIYLPTDALRMYFAGSNETWFLDAAYEPWLETLTRLGLAGQPRNERRQADYLGYVRITSNQGWHERGVNHFDPGFDIDGLLNAVTNPNIERSRYVWNSLLPEWARQMHGTVETSTRQDFAVPRAQDRWSSAGVVVRDGAWLPALDGQFVGPGEIKLSDLPEDFEKDTSLASALGMKIGAIDELARESGIREDLLIHLMNNPDQQERLLRLLERENPSKNDGGTSTASEKEEPEAPSPAVPSTATTGAETGSAPRSKSEGGGSGETRGDGTEGGGSSPGDSETQTRLPVYLAADDGDPDGTEDPDKQLLRETRDKVAVDRVMAFEEEQGRVPERKSHSHPGYDVESVEADGSVRFIEVKGVGATWGVRGVGLTDVQFETAMSKGKAYWLYVVENVDDPERTWIYRINDPARRATTFMFDTGWKDLTEG